MPDDRWTMDDLSDEVRARRDNLLAKLSVLPEARAQVMNDASPSKHPKAAMEPGKTWLDHSRSRKPTMDSKEPPGVREGRSNASHPEHGNLFDWFASRLARAKSEAEVRKLCTLGEAKWERATGRVKAPLALAANPETTKARDQRIAKDPDYLGEPPDVVAVADTHVSGHISAENVRRVRLAAGLDPETGHPLPAERFMEGPARRRRARELDGEGMPVVKIARRFGVHSSTVLGWLNRRQRPDGENGERAA